MKTNKNLGLYIHIPFCVSKCSYCDFYSVVCDENLKNEYIDKVIAHLNEYAIAAKGYIIDTIYIGGGTPSTLDCKLIIKLFKTIYKCLHISPQCEITFETNPESVDKKLLKTLKKCKVNRISLGVQSSNDEVLEKLLRPHNFEDVKNAVFLMRKHKFTNISLDLIYGVENQTIEQLETDLAKFLALDIMHISAYALKIEQGTKMHHDGVLEIDEDLSFDMYQKICNVLQNAGFEHYEVSNFAKDKKYSKHNLKYWNLDEYLGIGPSAHSFFGNKRFSYTRDINQYIIEPTLDENEEIIPLKSRFGEYIMLKLRTSEGINEDTFYNLFYKDFNIYLEKSAKFIENGYAKYENGRFYLTDKGFYISNYIINELIN